jgi:hypothetical protein
MWEIEDKLLVMWERIGETLKMVYNSKEMLFLFPKRERKRKRWGRERGGERE